VPTSANGSIITRPAVLPRRNADCPNHWILIPAAPA
jgi:hypothetical protein